MPPKSLHQPSFLLALHACLPGSMSPRALHMRGGVIGQPCYWAGLVLKSLSITSGTQHAGGLGFRNRQEFKVLWNPGKKRTLT